MISFDISGDDFLLDSIPNAQDPGVRSKVQDVYRNISELTLCFDYSYVEKFSIHKLWDASNIKQNSFVMKYISEFEKQKIGTLANNHDKGDFNEVLSFYDIKIKSRQISKCFQDLLIDLKNEYDCTILHRLTFPDTANSDKKGSIRVWGILQGNVFIILLLDLHHMIMPDGNGIKKLGTDGEYACSTCQVLKFDYKTAYDQNNSKRRRKTR